MKHLFAWLLTVCCVAGMIVPQAAHAQGGRRGARGQFCYIQRIEQRGEGQYVLFADYAEYLEGDAAAQAARDDSAEYSSVYIRNASHGLRELPVASYAQIYLLQQGALTLVRLPLFARVMQAYDAARDGTFYGFPFGVGDSPAYFPCRVFLRGGTVVRLEQVATP